MKSLDEMADDLLREFANMQGKSMRQIGVIDERRERTIRSREIPMSSVNGRKRDRDV